MWCVDNLDELEIFGYYGKEVKYINLVWIKFDYVGDNWVKLIVNVIGNYKFIFDVYLERVKFILVN